MFKWLLAVMVLLSGCALIKQGVSDYQAGKNTPIASGEQSPKDQAQQIVDLIKNVPVAGNYAGVLLPILAGFLTWKRGKRIRTAKIGDRVISGSLGATVGIGSFNLENLIKLVSDTIHGAFEIGADGSAIKRTWKIWLSIILASVSGALFIPGVKEFVLSNAKSLTAISFLAGLFGGLEKKIQGLGIEK
jgi:hypothetical protein